MAPVTLVRSSSKARPLARAVRPEFLLPVETISLPPKVPRPSKPPPPPPPWPGALRVRMRGGGGEEPWKLEGLKVRDATEEGWSLEPPGAEGKSIAFSLMRPTAVARRVLPGELYKRLVKFALEGCRADCGPPWSEETLATALERGVNPSALEPEVVQVLWDDLKYQQEAGFVRIVPAEELLGRDKPRELKISPVAVIPQVGRRPRIILNLSAEVKTPGTRRKPPTVQPSVNETTVPAEDQTAVKALGTAIKSLILLAYEVPWDWIIVWQKVDLSDGFWGMVVDAGMEYNFVFQLPHKEDDTQDHFVVPGALQMGWKTARPTSARPQNQPSPSQSGYWR